MSQNCDQAFFILKIKRNRANVYYTYTPNPLSDRIVIKTDEELTMLLSKVHRLLGILGNKPMC